MAPVSRKKLSDGVIDEIRRMLEQGELKIGDKLPVHSELAKQLQSPVPESPFERGDKQAAEQPRKHAHGKKEARRKTHPALPVRAQAAAGNHAMEVRMMQ